MIWNFSEQVNPNFCERRFFMKIMEKLHHLDDSFNFIITNYDDNTLPLFHPDKKNIIIYLSDEYGIFKSWFNKVDLIFREYPTNYLYFYKNQKLYDNVKIFPVPCGLVLPDFTNYEMEQQHKKLSERKYDFFYSGQISPNRTKFVQKIKSISSPFKTIIQENDNFRTGFSIDDYFKIMNETKISFVPLGKIIPESFRYNESFESGCVVINEFPIDKYKDIWYYKDSPAIFINDYEQINEKFIKQILDNIDSYYESNINYYDNFLSTNAICKFITKTINEKFI